MKISSLTRQLMVVTLITILSTPSVIFAQDIGVFNLKLESTKLVDGGLALITLGLFETNGESEMGQFKTEHKIQLNKLALHNNSTEFVTGKGLKKYFKVKYNKRKNVISFQQKKKPMKPDSIIYVSILTDVNVRDDSRDTESTYLGLNGFAGFSKSNIYNAGRWVPELSMYTNRLYQIDNQTKQCEYVPVAQ